MHELYLNRTDEGITFEIKVLPRSSMDEIAGVMDGKLKIKLTSAPVDGKANAALIKFLANILGVARGRIEIVRGETGRQKQILVREADSDVEQKLITLISQTQ